MDTATQTQTLSDGIIATKEQLIIARRNVAELEAMLQPKRDEVKAKIEALEAQFRAENLELIEAGEQLQASMVEAETALREGLIVWHESTGDKTFDKELSVRVNTKLKYDEDRAVEWATHNAPVLIKQTVDKKAFESMPMTPDLDFVTVERTVTAVVKSL